MQGYDDGAEEVLAVKDATEVPRDIDVYQEMKSLERDPDPTDFAVRVLPPMTLGKGDSQACTATFSYLNRTRDHVCFCSFFWGGKDQGEAQG